MNFDGLDQDLDIGYTPTIASNSRSAGMKKLNRKSQTKPTSIAVNSKKSDDFDLLDDLLASPAKAPVKSVQKSKQNTSLHKNTNQVDSFFDEPTLPIASKNTLKVDSSSTSKPAIKPPVSQIQDTILEQNEPKTTSFKFKRPQTSVSTVGIKKQQEPQIIISPSPSVRMMKPPLRKRQSMQKPKQQLNLLNTNTNNNSKSVGGLGLVLPDQPQKSTQSLSQKQDDKYKSVNLANKRRSSIEMNTNELSLQLNADDAIGKNKNEQSTHNVQYNNPAPQEKLTLFKTFDNEKPKQTKPNIYPKQQLTLPEQKKQQKKSFWQSQKSIQINQKPSYNAQQNSPPFQPYQASSVTGKTHEQFQTELQFIKKSYQSHISSLQKNLQDQIKSNKQTRDKLIKQSNSMIENERVRMKKMHQEQIDRIKAIYQWEKKKVEDQYSYQVDGLKAQIQRFKSVTEDDNRNKGISQGDRRQIQYLEDKLRAERKILQDRIKLLDKRQLDLQQREKQFNKRKRNEQQRLRNEERRILQYEMDSKKQVVDQKRSLEEEKQQMASQLVALEMGNYKKSENIQQLRLELERKQSMLERQKNEMHNLNNTMMLQYQKKCEQLNMQKQKVQRLQSELLVKIRVVQSTRQRLNTTAPMQSTPTPTLKQNNWVHINTSIDKPRAENIKQMSIQKKNQYRKVQNTQNRFVEMAANMKQSLNIGKKGKQFDLDNYLMSMAKFTRARQAIH